MKHLFILLCLAMAISMSSYTKAQTPDQLQVSHVTAGGLAGDVMLISGQHLQSVTSVLFNGVPVKPTKVDPKGFFVEANVPSQATTGPITLQTGSTRFLTKATFRVLPRSAGISPETQRIIDSDRLPAGTSPRSVTIPTPASSPTAQARVAATGGTISGLKFSDDNRNRIQDVQTVIGSPAVLFVLDVSGSTIGAFAGTTVGDLNGDNRSNTRLDAEIGVIERIRTELISQGAVNSQIGIIKFSNGVSSVDVNPTVTGIQNFAKVGDDKNANGKSDISDTYSTLLAGGQTNYEIALKQAITVVNSLSATQDIKLIFLSDGVPNLPTGNPTTAYSDEVTILRGKANVSLSAIGVGSDSQLAPLQAIDPNAKRVTDFTNLINFSLAIITPLENGLAGVTLYLDLNNNGQKDTGEPFQTSSPNNTATTADETGTFSFSGLAAGTYTVREVVPTGYMQTAPADKSYSVTITGTESFTSTNFGNVRDEVKPMITGVPASLTVSCVGDVPTAASGVTATDNFDPAPTLVVNDTRVDGSCTNRFVITRTWTATDQAGNQATASQNITVNDNTAPILNGVPIQPVVVSAQAGVCSATLTFPAIMATDNCSGAITLTYLVGGSAVTPTSSFSLGVTTVQVVATDLCGNQATSNFVVQVNDVTAPVPNLAQLPSLTKACSLSITDKPTATDNCGGQITATTTDPLTYSVPGSYTITWTYTDPAGNKSQQTQGIQISQLQAPVLVTASGGSYPAGQSSLTISQNTGNVILAVSGCAGGTITWAGGSSSTLSVSTFNAGLQTFTAICTQNGCTSPAATATVRVVPTTLSVLHRDATNNQLSTNTLAPYLELQNEGNSAIPYQEITLRYYLTVENPAPLQFQLNYAQLGTDKVHLRYVPATTGNPGATGYIEFSFDASAGSLAPNSNSGPIQDLINKQDFSAFYQGDDYSYMNNGNYTPNPHITAYRNGVIFYGLEPGPFMATQSVKALLQNNTGPTANAIALNLQVVNDGNLPISYGDLKVRYYFTADGNQPLVVNGVGYMPLGSGNVTGQIVTISPPLVGADRYLEVSFSPSLGSLTPGATTGDLNFEIRKSDYSGFNQLNDYSYQGTGGMMVNAHVVVFVGGVRAYGTEPGAGARQGVEEAGKLTVQVLGNPVTGQTAQVAIRGVEGQSVQVELTDLQGRAVYQQRIGQAGAIERVSVPLGSSAGVLLLQVSTPTQHQQIKLLKQ